MAGEKYNIQLEAIEIFNRLQQVPQLAEGLSNLLQNFNSHNHDLRNDTRYQPLGDYAADVHTHSATDITEDSTHKFMTQTEKNTLSSLGTNAALKDFSNVTTKSLGQNGYYKFPDGLMIQWGYTTNSGSNKTIYFPQAFADTNYSIVANFFIDNANDGTVYCMQIKYKGVSYYRATCTQNTTDNDHGITERPYFYIVIGRWK